MPLATDAIHSRRTHLPTIGKNSVERPSTGLKWKSELGDSHSITILKTKAEGKDPHLHRPPPFPQPSPAPARVANHNTRTRIGLKAKPDNNQEPSGINLGRRPPPNFPPNDQKVGGQPINNWRALATAHGSSPEWEGPAVSKLWGKSQQSPDTLS